MTLVAARRQQTRSASGWVVAQVASTVRNMKHRTQREQPGYHAWVHGCTITKPVGGGSIREQGYKTCLLTFSFDYFAQVPACTYGVKRDPKIWDCDVCTASVVMVAVWATEVIGESYRRYGTYGTYVEREKPSSPSYPRYVSPTL